MYHVESTPDGDAVEIVPRRYELQAIILTPRSGNHFSSLVLENDGWHLYDDMKPAGTVNVIEIPLDKNNMLKMRAYEHNKDLAGMQPSLWFYAMSQEINF